jgi:hypothetical protein
MAENKKSFILYADIISTIEKLTDDQSGKLFKIILQYVNDLNPEVDDLLLQIAFEPIKQQLKRDLKKWDIYHNKQVVNGKMGGRPKTQKTQAFYEKPKKAANVNANANVNDNVINIKFDEFRKAYPGTKRGLETEFENFTKKHSDWKAIIEGEKLMFSLKNQIRWRNACKEIGKFVPEWKNLTTWINQRCWEEIHEKKELEA